MRPLTILAVLTNLAALGAMVSLGGPSFILVAFWLASWLLAGIMQIGAVPNQERLEQRLDALSAAVMVREGQVELKVADLELQLYGKQEVGGSERPFTARGRLVKVGRSLPPADEKGIEEVVP